MNNENKPLMYPDRVLSMVVLVLSLLMILSIASLSYMQYKMDLSSAMISGASNQFIEQLLTQRQQVETTGEEDGSSDNQESTQE